VEAEVVPDGRGAHRVVVRRRGFLVSLRHDGARSAGRDWAAIRIAIGEGAAEVAGRMIWETTRLDGGELDTSRGLVVLSGRSGAISPTIRAAAPPAPAASYRSQRAACAGHHDGVGGYAVVCRFARGVVVNGVANVTGAHPLDDAWLVPGPSPLVRLDLPRSALAEGRVIGLTQGATGVALRMEATFLEGEEPRLSFQATERVQPAPVF
jgi:hypothetical protein